MITEYQNPFNLKQHIEKINAETQAWIDEDPKNRWGGMLVTDPEHWAEYGVYTPEDYDKSSLAETIAQASKDATGSKYRVDWMEYSVEELKKQADYWCKEAQRTINEEEAFKIKSAKEFETRIQDTIELGARNRETALKWILQADDLLGNNNYYMDGYAAYNLNLPSSYEKELDGIIMGQKEAA